ncbi:MAG: DUF5681 domain-containing protein [Aestuariivirga sp.]
MSNKIAELESTDPANDNEKGAIGYGKPPTAQQFKPGQSGNLKGRPPGSKNKRPNFGVEQLKSTVLDEVYRDIEVQEGEQTLTLPTATAIIRKMVAKAAAGDTRAAQIITTMVQNIERENRLRLEENLQIASDYRRFCSEEQRYREVRGYEPLTIFPDSKYANVDFESGDIQITGPLTVEEQVRWDAESSARAADDGSTAIKSSIPRRILARSKNFPDGFWNGEKYLRRGEIFRSNPV